MWGLGAGTLPMTVSKWRGQGRGKETLGVPDQTRLHGQARTSPGNTAVLTVCNDTSVR